MSSESPIVVTRMSLPGHRAHGKCRRSYPQKRDVDAIEKIEITGDPENPGFIQVRQFPNEGTKFEEDLEGFSSSQL